MQWEYDCAFAPDGATVATAGYDRTVRIWQVSSGELARILTGHTDIVAGVAFSTDGRLLATGSHDRTIRIWDVATGATRLVLDGHTDAVVGIDFARMTHASSRPATTTPCVSGMRRAASRWIR